MSVDPINSLRILPKLLLFVIGGCFVATHWVNALENPSTFKEVLADPDPSWFASEEGRRATQQVMLFQYSSGGWPKNKHMLRNLSDIEIEKLKGEKDFATIDNGATYTPMRFLAHAYQATGDADALHAFNKGMDYLFESQMENGGWPVFYPRSGSYFGVIHFNDDSIVGVLKLFRDIVEAKAPFEFVSKKYRDRASLSLQKGIACILQTQVRVNGELTVWCAQHDPETLLPAKARAYELPSLSGSESANIVSFLMGIDSPSDEVKTSIDAAVIWFRENVINGLRIETVMNNGTRDRVVVNDAKAPPIWARFYELGTNLPIFVGRDGVIKYRLNEIEQERRAGYRYYADTPAKMLKQYEEWTAKWDTSDF